MSACSRQVTQSMAPFFTPQSPEDSGIRTRHKGRGVFPGVLLSICLALACAGVIAFSYITARDIAGFALETAASFSEEAHATFGEQATGIAVERIVAQARIKASAVEGRLGEAMAVAGTLAETLGWIRESGGGLSMNREDVRQRLRLVLESHPEFASVYTCWEPGMFAGDYGVDAQGFVEHWMRLQDGGIQPVPLHEHESAEDTGHGVRRGEFHLLVRETGVAHLLPLHPYRTGAGHMWMTTAVAPIKVHDAFAGSIGVSYRLDFMHNLMAALKESLFGGLPETFIIAGSGHVAASTRENIREGTHLSALGLDWRRHLQTIREGASLASLEGETLVIIIPIGLSSPGQRAAVLITVPESVIAAEAALLQDSLSGEMDILQRTISQQRDELLWRQMGVGGVLAVVTFFTIVLLHRLGQQKNALRESEERLREILLNTSNMVYVKDRLGRITFANPSVERVLGRPLPEIIGRTEEDLLPPDSARQHAEHDEATYAADRPLQWEENMVLDDASGTFLTTKFPLHDSSGRINGLCSIAVDISERSRSEQRMKEMERYLSDIIDSMPSILIGVNEQGAITHWNRLAARQFGIGREEAMHRPFIQTVPMLADEWGRVEAAIAAGMPQTNERKHLDMRGRGMVVRLVVYPLRREQKSEAVIRIDDITSQIRIEEMMVQTEKMLSVGGLAAGMAHEINNPLGAILQGAQNIERRLSPVLPGNIKAADEAGCSLESIAGYLERRKVLHMIRGIRDAGERAARIVHNMLNFSRKSESVRTQADMAALVGRVIEMARSDYDLKKRYDIKKIDVEMRMPPDLPAVNCIETEIEQVLLNLIKNAAQAMAMSGTADPRIVVSAVQDGEWVVVTVQDNGPGMTETTRKRVFEPFFTTKVPGLGTGLGLSVTYFIITENHGGTIAVDSRPGSGARFTIRLPIHGHVPDSGV